MGERPKIEIEQEDDGRWVAEELSAENGAQLLVPRGFLHGFLTLGDDTVVSYLLDNPHDSASEGAVAWDDPDLGIAWRDAMKNVGAIIALAIERTGLHRRLVHAHPVPVKGDLDDRRRRRRERRPERALEGRVRLDVHAARAARTGRRGEVRHDRVDPGFGQGARQGRCRRVAQRRGRERLGRRLRPSLRRPTARVGVNLAPGGRARLGVRAVAMLLRALPRAGEGAEAAPEAARLVHERRESGDEARVRVLRRRAEIAGDAGLVGLLAVFDVELDQRFRMVGHEGDRADQDRHLLLGGALDLVVGIVVTAEGDTPISYGYVPVKNLDKLLDVFKGLVGPVRKVGDKRILTPPWAPPIEIIR